MAGKIIGFPNPVNEKAARVVGGGVFLLAAVVLATGWHWLIPVMALGFLVRVLTGPRLSPLGQLATRVVAPRLGGPVYVAGPPKRFAQAVGLTFTVAASLASFVFDARGVAIGLMVVLAVFAFLESALGFCAGCWVFARLMRWGVIPEETCEACNNIALRQPAVRVELNAPSR